MVSNMDLPCTLHTLQSMFRGENAPVRSQTSRPMPEEYICSRVSKHATPHFIMPLTVPHLLRPVLDTVTYSHNRRLFSPPTALPQHPPFPSRPHPSNRPVAGPTGEQGLHTFAIRQPGWGYCALCMYQPSPLPKIKH